MRGITDTGSAGNRTAGGLNARLFADRDRARQVWRALERTLGDLGLACSWEWTDAWLSHYGDLVPHRFVAAERAGSPVGIALLTDGVGRRRGRIPLRTLHVGTAGEPPGESVHVEENCLLVDRGYRDAFAGALLEAAAADNSWDELVLDGFAAEDAAAFVRREPGFSARREPCPAVDLRAAESTGGEVLKILTSNTRYQIRRSLRAMGPVSTEWASTGEQARDILDDLIDLHQQRWRTIGKPGAFSSQRFSAFHRDLVARLVPQGKVLLYRVSNATGTIGCLYSFLDQGNVLSYQIGVAPSDDNKVKPGFVSHGLCMQECFDRGLHDYNFLAGDSPYKRELSTGERELVWATLTRRRLRVVVGEGLQKARGLAGR